MKKSKKIGIVVFSLVFVSLIIIAMPLASIGGINVASASSLDYPGAEDDPCDDTKYFFHYGPPNPTDILTYCDGFKVVDEHLNELIKDIAKGLNKAKKYSPISVASATSLDDLPEDYYDDTIEGMGCDPDPASIMGYDDIKALDKPLNEPVKIPDEITDMVKGKVYIDNGKTKVSTIKISPTDLAVWMSVASTETKLIKPYLVYLDTDGDGKPEELAALYNYPYKESLAFEDFSSIEGHYKLVPSGHVPDPYGDFGYVINPFDTFKGTPEGLDEYWESTAKLIYIKNPDEIQVLPDKIIPWYEAVGKTPKELGLDKYDRFVSKTPETPDEVPTGEEVTPTPGFEVLFAIAGLLAVAYVLRGRK